MNRIQFLSLLVGSFVSLTQAIAADSDASKSTAEKDGSAAVKAYKNIGVEKFDKMRLKDTNAVVLDVRTPKEYEKAHIKEAKLIDFNSDDFEKEISKLDTNKTYLVHCASGGRSAAAAEKLTKLNFPKVYNLEGGVKAWQKAGKPVETK